MMALYYCFLTEIEYVTRYHTLYATEIPSFESLQESPTLPDLY